jgi:hypothetical protein
MFSGCKSNLAASRAKIDNPLQQRCWAAANIIDRQVLHTPLSDEKWHRRYSIGKTLNSDTTLQLFHSLLITSRDDFNIRMQLKAANHFKHSSSSVALPLAFFINHQSHNKSYTRSKFIHRESNHWHFRLFVTTGSSVVDNQRKKIGINIGFCERLCVSCNPTLLRLRNLKI